MEFMNSLPDIEILPPGSNNQTALSFLKPQKTPAKENIVNEAGDNLEIIHESESKMKENLRNDEEDEEEILTFKRSNRPQATNIFERGNINNNNIAEYADEDNLAISKKKEDKLVIHTERVAPKNSNKQQIYENYNVMLNFTDISYGVKGHNKFYQIQILHRNNTEFTLFTKWGRVGAQNPQSQNVVYPSKYDAIVAFKRKFADKTLNDWDKRDKFVWKGKYTMIQVENQENCDPFSVNQEIERLNKRNEFLQSKIKNLASQLERNVKNLMELIWDIDKMNKALKKLRFDVDKAPLGKLSLDQIQKGYKILTEIQKILVNGGKDSMLIELTNQFYTNIPHNYGMQKIPMIDQISHVREKIQLLDLLKDIDIANRFISIALKGDSTINPLDSFYKMLKISLNVVAKEDYYYGLIEEMLKNCHGPTHKFRIKIQNIFKLEKENEKERYYPFQSLHNRMFLWHGSRLTNYVGILSEGLRIAPSDAPSTGYMFGKGIYFTDVASKAAGYCHASPENNEGLLVLCEVALGNMYQVFKAKGFKKPPKYYHSVHGVGRMHPDPKKKIQGADNVISNLGSIINNEELENNRVESDLIYNEYIVYDVAQVWMKYLVKISFEFF